MLVLTLWYLNIQHLWLMHIPGVSRWRAWIWATVTFGGASLVVALANIAVF